MVTEDESTVQPIDEVSYVWDMPRRAMYSLELAWSNNHCYIPSGYSVCKAVLSVIQYSSLIFLYYFALRIYKFQWSITMFCIFRWPCGLKSGSAAARLLGLQVRIPQDMDVCLFWVLSGRGLCDCLITRPEDSTNVVCLAVILKRQ